MGKKRKLHSGLTKPHRPPNGQASHSKSSPARHGIPSSKLKPQSQSKPPHSKPQLQPQPPEPPTIPFDPEHRILLVGEGDLSFAASLVEHHGCTDVTATVPEKSLDELKEKYPHVEANIAKVLDGGGKVLYAVDALKMPPFLAGRRGAAAADRPGAMDRVAFNFPHVGGRSTDVNRQVRHNQELLVGFFRRALPSLAPRAGAAVVVTVFEGEPYSLWNVRDLARHAGLRVARTFAFRAAAYPGYSHARTLGVIRGKDGEVGGGWKGEERPARSYVFMRKEDEEEPLETVTEEKKRKRAEEEDSDED